MYQCHFKNGKFCVIYILPFKKKNNKRLNRSANVQGEFPTLFYHVLNLVPPIVYLFFDTNRRQNKWIHIAHGHQWTTWRLTRGRLHLAALWAHKCSQLWFHIYLFCDALDNRNAPLRKPKQIQLFSPLYPQFNNHYIKKVYFNGSQLCKGQRF